MVPGEWWRWLGRSIGEGYGMAECSNSSFLRAYAAVGGVIELSRIIVEAIKVRGT